MAGGIYAKVTFLPSNESIEVPVNTKILVAAKKANVDIVWLRLLRCGTCGIKVSGSLQEMKKGEAELLEKMGLSTSGEIRLACQAKCEGDITVDLDFQSTYSPDQNS